MNKELGLTRSNAHFASPKGSHLFERLQGYAAWIDSRRENGLFPYARSLASAPAPEADIAYLGGAPVTGINLAVQDYLGFASHELVEEAAIRAIHEVGVHSAGSPMLLGNNRLSAKLENELSDFLETDHVLLFPTGWAAGFGTVKALVRPYDHIVMDTLAHACLQEGAAAATKNISRYTHLDVDDAIERVRQIRSASPESGILVIAEGLYSMDSDVPDIARLQEACRGFDAQLLVDVAHDLGSMGPGGTGTLGAQAVLGEIDIVIGAFSKTFASNGGFVAVRDERVKTYLRWFANPHTFSNAISPIQCAIVSAALKLVRGKEGARRRHQLLDRSEYFRRKLRAKGCHVLGQASAIVPVLIGSEATARIASRNVNASGTFTNLVEFPAVGLRAARFRCQLMATHSEAHLSRAATDIALAIQRAWEEEAESLC